MYLLVHLSIYLSIYVAAIAVYRGTYKLCTVTPYSEVPWNREWIIWFLYLHQIKQSLLCTNHIHINKNWYICSHIHIQTKRYRMRKKERKRKRERYIERKRKKEKEIGRERVESYIKAHRIALT